MNFTKTMESRGIVLPFSEFTFCRVELLYSFRPLYYSNRSTRYHQALDVKGGVVLEKTVDQVLAPAVEVSPQKWG